MQKQIVVHIDPLNLQHNVVNYAAGLARQLDLPLLLYSVQSMTRVPMNIGTASTMTSFSLAIPPSELVKEINEKERLYCEEVKRQYPKTEYEHDLGQPGEQLIEKVKDLHHSLSERDPYLLVMEKTSGYDAWNDIIGTAETTVAEKAPCPVLFVPEDTVLTNIDRVMYLADEESLNEIAYPGFNFLRAFAKKMEAKTTVGFLGGELSTKTGYDVGAAMERLRHSLPFQENHEFRFFSNMNAEEILTMAAITHMDIVAFPFRESNFLARFFDNEMTRTLLLKAKSPIMVF